MAYQICKRCSTMFEKNGKLYCKNCFEKNNREYDLIVNHVRKNPNSTVLDVIEETGVSLKSINCLVEDGCISYVESKLSIEDKNEDSNVVNRILPKTNKFYSRR